MIMEQIKTYRIYNEVETDLLNLYGSSFWTSLSVCEVHNLRRFNYVVPILVSDS